MEEDQYYLEELKKDFFDEAQTLIDILETNILAIEKDPSNQEAINEIFRAAHTMKGGSATLDLDRISNFTHEMESLLEEIRSGNIKLTEDIIDTLLQAIDIVKELFQAAMDDKVPEEGFEDKVLQEIREHYMPSVSDETKKAALDFVKEEKIQKKKKVDFKLNEYDAHLIKTCQNEGQTIFEIQVILSSDNPMKTVSGIQIHSILKEYGNVIKSLPDIDDLMQDSFHKEILFLYATTEDRERIQEKISISDVVDLVEIQGYEDAESVESQVLGIRPEEVKVSPEEAERVEAALKAKKKVFQIHLIFDDSNPMRSVSGVLLHSMLNSQGDVVRCFPSFEELKKDLFFDNTYFVVITEMAEDELREKLYLSDVTKQLEFKTIRSKEDLLIEDEDEMLSDEYDERLDNGGDAKAAAINEEIKTRKKEAAAEKFKKDVAESKPQQVSMLRVESRRIDDLLNKVSELVITNASFQELTDKNANLLDSIHSTFVQYKKDVKQLLLELSDEDEKRDPEEEKTLLKEQLENLISLFDPLLPQSKQIQEKLRNSSQNLNRTTKDLHESVMKVRMVPINHVFGRFPRLVRDLSKSLNREVNLIMEGEDTELDKGMVEDLFDPLVHIIRNAVDHGIETASERKRMGKDPAGTIRMAAEHEGNNIVITISDDGKGFNFEKIKEKAIEKGLVDPGVELSKRDTLDLVFQPGFSTQDSVSSVSGRGVGMDVVKRKIEGIKGTLEIDTEDGKGTTFVIKLPMTLAIVQALLVRVSDYIYSIPITHVGETQRTSKEEIELLEDNEVIKVRDEVLALVRLEKLFKHKSKADDEYFYVIIVELGSKKVGLVVDNMIGEQDVVIKPLDNKYANVLGIMGATILGDGQVSLIIDIAGIFDLVAQQRENQLIGMNA